MTNEERAALKDVAVMQSEYLSILEGTEEAKITEFIYESYINCEPAFITSQEAAVGQISRALDDKSEKGSATSEDLADYEEAARRAGFYAGFKAGMAYIRFLRCRNDRINGNTVRGAVIETPRVCGAGQDYNGEGDCELRKMHDHVLSMVECLNFKGLARAEGYIDGLLACGGEFG